MPQAKVRLTITCLALLAAMPSPGSTGRIDLEVDATNVAQGIQHVHETIPVQPGPLTLAYPKWIPGEHKPTGPVTQLMNLHVTAGGTPLTWFRDPLDAFLFHFDIPSDVSALDVRFDYFSPPRSFGTGFGETPNVTPHLLILPFNQLVLYPADTAAEAIQVSARVHIPHGWAFDGALQPVHTADDQVTLPPVSLTTLVDSPLLAGEYFRVVPLKVGAGAARISIAADSPADLAASEPLLAGLRNLIPEATALLGPGHFRSYTWLVALGNSLGHDGLEHHESSDVREDEELFTNAAFAINWRVLPHELMHSWNGKYRRPDGLMTRNYQQPMNDNLLWAYEGLTRYYGDLVLTARSGLATQEGTRAYLAYVASQMARDRPGRAWRPVADTATAVPEYSQAPGSWGTVRRGADYYNEMLLVWLEADALIRQRTSGKRSLDDFCHVFFAGPEREPAVRPYSRSDLIAALNGTVSLDWEGFFHSRVDAIAARAPLDGLSASGWTLVYDDTPNAFLQAVEKTSFSDNLSLSLGIWTKSDGSVVDVVGGSPAFAAGVAPAMQIIAIDGHRWTIEAARTAIVVAETKREPLELIVSSDDVVRTVRVDYHGGLQNPHLLRDGSKPDMLSAIIAPRRTTHGR